MGAPATVVTSNLPSADLASIAILLSLAAWLMLACGRLTLGTTAFAAIGAGLTAQAISAHWPPVAAVAGSIVVTACVAYVLGFPMSKLDPTRFAVFSLALAVAAQIAVASLAQRRAHVISDWHQGSSIWVAAVVAFVMWRLLR